MMNTPSVSSTHSDAPKREANIGRILLEMNKIKPEQAERVLILQKQEGIRFGEAAQRLGFVTQEDIQLAIAKQFDFSYLKPGQGDFPPELIAAYQPFSEQVETLRAIRSQLMLRWFTEGNKSLTLASVDTDSGTSICIANLAVVFSQLGEKTLLIDANLRNSSQHTIFNLQHKQGLSDCLADRLDAIPYYKIEGFSNLSVLTAGTPVPNPQELIGKPVFKQILEILSQYFDVILIDAPSFEAGADVLTIASYTTGLVLLTRKHYTRMDTIQSLYEKIQTTPKVSLIGSVFMES